MAGRRKPGCSAEPELAGFAEVDCSSSVREGDLAGAPTPCGSNGRPVRGHIPIPEKRNFPIDIPRKEIHPTVGRSAQTPSPECLRNATQNESALLGLAIVLCLVAVIPIWGSLQGYAQQLGSHVFDGCQYLSLKGFLTIEEEEITIVVIPDEMGHKR